MKLLLLIAVFQLAAATICAQPAVEKSVCPYSCPLLSLQDYKKGMLFYFPKIAALSETNPRYAAFSEKNRAAGDTSYNEKVFYQQLEGKTLEIIKTSILPLKSYPGDNYRQFTFTLANQSLADTFQYKTVIDKNMLASADDNETENESYYIKGGVDMQEVATAKKALEGKIFYALFPINEIRFEEIKITQVEAGTWETPLLLHFDSPTSKDEKIYVNLCGNNLPVAYRKSFHFTKFFSCENPQGGIADARWKLIKAGKPIEGMTVTEIQLMLGKPVSISNKTSKSSPKKTKITYPSYILIFIDDKLFSSDETK